MTKEKNIVLAGWHAAAEPGATEDLFINIATVQGWQLADELNRAFAANPPSGYIPKPISVTTPPLKKIGSSGIDPELPYLDVTKPYGKQNRKK